VTAFAGHTGGNFFFGIITIYRTYKLIKSLMGAEKMGREGTGGYIYLRLLIPQLGFYSICLGLLPSHTDKGLLILHFKSNLKI
jgi:hypothetical protein